MNSNSLVKFSNASSIFCLLIVLFACTHKKGLGIKNATTKIKIEVKEEKHYYVKDRLDNLDFMDTMKIKDYYKQNYEPLSDSLKISYLSHYFKDESGHSYSQEVLKTDIKAFLIARIDITSFFKPTLIKIYGKDFTALFLANIEREGVIVLFGETLYNYKFKNPKVLNDTLIVTQPKYKFDFQPKESFMTYVKTIGTIVINPITKKRDYFIDKTTYEIALDASGGMYNKILEKSRISQKFEIEDFRSY